MTLREALLQGRPFRRPNRVGWFPVATRPDSVFYFSVEDLTAQDWEVQPAEKCIDLATLQKVLEETYRTVPMNAFDYARRIWEAL